MGLPEPSMDQWLTEAKQDKHASQVGIYLTHNGVVRATPRHTVRAEEYASDSAHNPNNSTQSMSVAAVQFSYDHAGVEEALAEARTWEGIYYVRAWLNEGKLAVGETLMYVLIGADIRPHAVDALTRLVDRIKTNLVTETEIYESNDL